MDKIIEIREEPIYKNIEVEIDGKIVIQQELDYTLKHTYEDDALVETMQVWQGDGYINQIQVYPISKPTPPTPTVEERLGDVEVTTNQLVDAIAIILEVSP